MSKTFTKIEAIELMKQGVIMTHSTFTNDETITMKESKFEFEDGCRCTPEEFWKYRKGEIWQKGWSIKSQL